MTGNAGYTPAPGMEDGLHVVGPGDRPIAIVKKKDVPGLFSSLFWEVFQIWRYFNAGFGLPGGRPWDEQDPVLMDYLLGMEEHYRRELSDSQAQVRYMDAMLRTRR